LSSRVNSPSVLTYAMGSTFPLGGGTHTGGAGHYGRE
jgi:hypothetical protein